MSRAPFQILVLPFRESPSGFEYAVFRRADNGLWQFIAGGGEERTLPQPSPPGKESNETPEEAARREAWEEAGIGVRRPMKALASRAQISVDGVGGFLWGPDVSSVPEHCFAVEFDGGELAIGEEHTEFRWVDYETAMSMLHWESNRVALEELDTMLMDAGVVT